MRSLTKNLTCLAILAAPLVFGVPALAQQPAQQPNNSMMMPPPAGVVPGTMDNRAERREFREEREQIRAEHEKLEAEADQLKTDCLNASGQAKASCEARHQQLREEREALHARWQALHDKMVAAGVPMPPPHEHEGMKPLPPMQQGNMQMPPPGGNAPPPSTPMGAPQGQ